MRSWHMLVLTVGVCLLLLAREAPSAASTADPPSSNAGASRSFGHRGELMPMSALDHHPPTSALKAVANSSSATVTAASSQLTVARGSNVNGAEGIPQVSDPFIALGVVSNVMWGDSFERRKWIRETWKTYSNVGKTMDVVFVVGMLQSNLKPIGSGTTQRLREEAAAQGDMLILNKVPERKSPCLKTMAWFRYASQAYPRAAFIAKTDDDAFVATIKLETNMRRFVHTPHVYIGSTLWGTYITKTFEACARRMGPMMAVGGIQEEKCMERGAIGPYPYAVGMLQVLSYQVASWMVQQSNYAEFERRATAATGTDLRPDGTPLIMDHGEDMVIGLFLYLSPFPLMPLHWGWDKLHDLCFKCERKDQIWRPITWQTVVAHHVANEDIIKTVFKNVSRVCDDQCQRKELPFEVTSLEDLCSRGSIKTVYSKCAMLKN